MALSDIIAFIKTTMDGIANIGNVYDYERVAIFPEDLASIWHSSGAVRTWSIERERTDEQYETNTESTRESTLLIRGYLEVNDVATSGKTFRSLLETVADTFRPHYKITTFAELFGPLQIDQGARGGYVMLADTVLCHYAECRLRSQERQSI